MGSLKIVLICAWRNVISAKHRSLLLMLIITVTTFSTVTFIAFSERVFWGVRESTINSQSGHLQIMKKGYWEHRYSEPADYLMAGVDETIELVKANMSNITVITKRLEFSGLIGRGENTTIFSGVGVQPDEDALLSSFDSITSGKSLADFAPQEGVMGIGLAEMLNLQIGEAVLVMAPSVRGALNAVDMKVRGIFQSDSEDYNARTIKIPLPLASKLMRTNSVSRIVILLEDTSQTAAAKRTLQHLIQKNRWDLIVKDWRELNPSYEKIKDLYSRMFFFLGIVMVVLVAVSVGNTTLVNVLERTRELALMRTMGGGRNLLKTIFFTENLLLSTVGLALGICAFTLIFGTINKLNGGIPMPPPPGTSRAVLFALETPWQYMSQIYIALLTTMFGATALAMKKISRLEISSALRR